jgi:hypothetical protein
LSLPFLKLLKALDPYDVPEFKNLLKKARFGKKCLPFFLLKAAKVLMKSK